MQLIVCISGQIRTARICLPSLMTNLRSSGKTIYSISVWEEEFNEWLDLIQILNISEVIIKPYKSSKPAKIPNWIYSRGHRAAESTKPMFFLMQKSFEQIQNNLSPKDVVVRYRPDLYLTEPLFIDSLDLSKVWLKHKINETYYSDQFFISNATIASLLFNTYNEIPWYWQQVVEDDKFIPTGEKLFRRIIQDKNLNSDELKLQIPIIREKDSCWLKSLKKYSHFRLVLLVLKLHLKVLH